MKELIKLAREYGLKINTGHGGTVYLKHGGFISGPVGTDGKLIHCPSCGGCNRITWQEARAKIADPLVILKTRFEPITKIGPSHTKRMDCRHEGEFYTYEIDALEAAGYATVKNRGYNVYYVVLTDKGRKASGLTFGWMMDGKPVDEALKAYGVA